MHTRLLMILGVALLLAPAASAQGEADLPALGPCEQQAVEDAYNAGTPREQLDVLIDYVQCITF